MRGLQMAKAVSDLRMHHPIDRGFCQVKNFLETLSFVVILPIALAILTRTFWASGHALQSAQLKDIM
jgi:hypothetical protein